MTQAPEVLPSDAHNRKLVSNVHPSDHREPEPATRYNLVVIGAGTAGLVTAAGAAGLGARVALVERHLFGGDCLNYGCVPSKTLIRSARANAELARAGALGVPLPQMPPVDFAGVMERVRAVRARISEHDSVGRFTALGVDVFLGEGRFTGPDTVGVNGRTLRFSRAVIATGARAAAPPIEGLAAAGFLTNETVFSLERLPARIAVIGAGPIGCELAQAFRRFGSEVHLLEVLPRILLREDADAAAIVERALTREGVRLLCDVRIRKVDATGAERVLVLTRGSGDAAKEERIAVDEILVGAGRRPNVDGLALETVGVEYKADRGVIVNDRLQTTNPRIYAAGDICMDWKFTHAADAAARIVIQNALFMGRKKLSALTMPWCTYTDPEIAHVGLYERDAAERGIEIDTFTRDMADVDRAIADGDDEGFVRVHVKRGTDRIVGATIVSRQAGEMISEITLAMVGGLGLKTVSTVIHPYPTHAEAIKQTADAYNRTRLTPRVRRLFEKWLAWRR